jgi:hypothetical protein
MHPLEIRATESSNTSDKAGMRKEVFWTVSMVNS